MACQTTATPRACFRLPDAPKTGSIANSLPPRPTLDLRPPPCVRHIAQPMSPARANAHPGRTPAPTHDPFALTYPEKSVTLARHPPPAQPHPIPLTSHLFATPAPFLPTNPPPIPQSRQHSRNSRTYVLPSPTLGIRLRGPESLLPNGTRPRHPQRKGSRKLATGHRRPPVLLCRVMPLPCPKNPRPALRTWAGPATLSARRSTECRRN